MLSAQDTAALLGVTSQRVRAMIAAGVLPARKVGNSWVIREEDVMARKEQGRSSGDGVKQASCEQAREPSCNMHELYEGCRVLAKMPLREIISQSASRDEAAFAIAVKEFFMQRAQRDLVERGCF